MAAIVGEDLEPWVAELIEALDLNIHPFATMEHDRTVWACMDQCSCLFIVDDTDFLDRFSLVTNEGPCTTRQNCPCHALPARRPGSEEEDLPL